MNGLKQPRQIFPLGHEFNDQASRVDSPGIVVFHLA